MNNLCSKQRIIYAEKTVNNFLNNAKQKIILNRKLEIVNAENKFYECSKQVWIYSKHDVQRAHFINVETDFINTEKQIRLLWNLNMKKHSDLVFKFRKHNFTMCFIRKQWKISKHGVLQLVKKKKLPKQLSHHQPNI